MASHGTQDEDPTLQIAWPAGRKSQPDSPDAEGFRAPLPILRASTPSGDERDDDDEDDEERGANDGSTPGAKKQMTIMDMIALSISMAGAQIVWTFELGWGTPFLLGLGMSGQATSLVWLAGPISGLIAQPLIGAISDASTSKYRRRAWIAGSTVVITIVGLTLGFAMEISTFFVDLFHGAAGDWDPDHKLLVNNTAIGLSVVCFYLLDFALNALQASLRNLLLDIVPAEQLAQANAWHGRMTHGGNVIGFSLGFLNLADWSALHFLGGTQFRKVCILSLLVLVLSVFWTCWTQIEKGGKKDSLNREGRIGQILKNIYSSVVDLPKPVRRVCFVQVCAFMGWFPFLFYGTTWIGQIMAHQEGIDPSTDRATRAGDLAMLFYSIVAIFAGTLLPYLSQRDRRLLAANEDEDVDSELARIREMVRQWKSEAARDGKPIKLPTMPFMLRNIWTAALALFVVVMASTFFIQTVFQASIAIAVLGICWAVACWVPFAIIMEFLREMEDSSEQARRAHASGIPPSQPTRAGARAGSSRPYHQRVASVPAHLWKSGQPPKPVTERTQLIRRHSIMGETGAFSHDLRYVGSAPVAGGTILGIHNLAIVFPQFLISILSSIIFRLADGTDTKYVYLGKTGVSWIFRVGGLCALAGAIISRRVPPTKTEKQMRRRLAEMRENENNGSP